MNILLIEDYPGIGSMLADELKDSGVRGCITSVDNRDTVLESLAAEGDRPDLILLDLFLQGFKGWDVLRDIRERAPHVPVLILSAYEEYKNDPRLREANGYIVKNSDLGPLIGKIHELVATGRDGAAA